MARGNRKKGAGGYLVSWRLIILLVAASLICLCYLWLRGRCEALGEELKALEVRKASLRSLYLAEESRWSDLSSPAEVEGALRRHGLVMTWPDQSQIVRLEPVRGPQEILQARWIRASDFQRVVMND